MLKNPLRIVLMLFLMTACSQKEFYTTVDVKNALMIAHAGGGYSGHNYTNSIEALEHNYQAGFRYFEVDFSWTSDDQMVCLHDWKKTFKKLFGKTTKQAMSYQGFTDMASKHTKFRVCDLALLAGWLKDKADVKIITDIKHRNMEGLTVIAERFPSLKSQFIPQFYQPEEYQLVKNLGFDDMIWILYQYKGSKQSVVELSQDMDLMAVSMRARQAKNNTFQQLLNHHRIFVYTINKQPILKKLFYKYGITGFYTDFLPVN